MFSLILDDDLQEMTVHGTDAFPYEIYDGGVSLFAEGYLDWHWHHSFEINYVTEGVLVYFVENRKYEIHPGEAVFINAGRLHRALSDDSAQQSLTIVFRPGLLCNDAASQVYENLIAAFVASRTESLHLTGKVPWMEECLSLLRLVFQTREESGFGHQIEIRGLICIIFAKILQNTPHDDILSSEETGIKKRLRNILTFLSIHYAEDLTLDRIASVAGLSSEECSRFFHRQMGIPLFTYLNRYRIEKACELLVMSDMPIGDIALSVGFNSFSYFSKRFSEIMHLSPGQYRRKIISSIS
ncbi:MAG: helix-turn-helix domain-containing protein [Lachnospiraceae bacterium]